MTGLKMMARDVSAQAFARKTGPFAGRPDDLRSPERMTQADSAYRNEITRLYQAILFRSPTSTETDSAFKLSKGVYGARTEIEGSDFELAFGLTVRDPATELSASRVIRIPVSGAPLGIYQERVDQSVGTDVQFDNAKAAGHLLKEPFHFVPGNNEQCVVVRNDHSVGNVSFAGLILKQVGTEESTIIKSDDPATEPEGAWKISTRSGLTS